MIAFSAAVLPIFGQSTPPTDDIYDIVVLAPKEPFWPLLLWGILGCLVLAALGWMLWYLIKGGKRTPANGSPESRALRRLKSAQREQAELSPNQFTLALSESLKDYLAERFSDPVRYETTPEFLNRIAKEQSRLPAAAQQQLQTFLVRAEEVKFGNATDAESKAAPLGKTAEQIVQLCQIVNEQEPPPNR